MQEFAEFWIDPSFNTSIPLHGKLANELALRTLLFLVAAKRQKINKSPNLNKVMVKLYSLHNPSPGRVNLKPPQKTTFNLLTIELKKNNQCAALHATAKKKRKDMSRPLNKNEFDLQDGNVDNFLKFDDLFHNLTLAFGRCVPQLALIEFLTFRRRTILHP